MTCKIFSVGQVRVGPPTLGDGRLDALASAGVGDDDALDVLDDVARHLRHDPLRGRTQDGPHPGRGVGEGDGLRTPGGGYELLFQDRDIGVLDFRVEHGMFLLRVIRQNLSAVQVPGMGSSSSIHCRTSTTV